MAGSIHAIPATTYYVSLTGNDKWSGTRPDPDDAGTDGPFRTVTQAQRVVRVLFADGRLAGPVTVCLRGGRYELAAPLTFSPADSGPVTYTSYQDEQVVLSGGRKLEGWQLETLANGRTAWVLDLPEVAEGKWLFRSLYVNGRRRLRPRLPKEGLYRIAEVPGMSVPRGWGNDGYDRFRLGKGQMQSWQNLADVEIVAFHFWIDERFPVAAFAEDTEMIQCSRRSRAPLTEAHGEQLAPCFLENVFEALSEPGEWYLDRAVGRLYYLPLPGEDPATTEVIAPRLFQLLRLEGDPGGSRPVEWLRFEGLTFAHTDWVQPGPEVEHWMAPAFVRPDRWQYRRYRKDRASSCQGAADVPGALYLEGARHCSIEGCRVLNIGWYGIQLADGCRGNRIVGNEVADLGAGGVHVDGATFDEAPCLRTGDNQITDNHIHECGRVFHSGIGVLAMNTFGNTISHNHIHDLYYSGISCGWVWGYTPSIARDNRIEKNHIHDLGQGLLSDMGGIYTLGVQPGTVIRGNRIHDVTKLNYGAWCIYPDEGSSHILIENNVCYRTNGEIFHQHYGRENIVRNNIFAFGGDSVLAHGRADLEHQAFTLEKNIFITDGKPVFTAGYGCRLADGNHRSDQNLIWDVSNQPLTFTSKGAQEEWDLAQWQAVGHDRHSCFADPKCKDLDGDCFELAADSPALDLGFVPIDCSDVGPR